MENGECAFSRCEVSCQVKPWSAEMLSGAQRCCGGLEEPVRGSARSGRVGKGGLASSYLEACAVFLSPPFLLEEEPAPVLRVTFGSFSLCFLSPPALSFCLQIVVLYCACCL